MTYPTQFYLSTNPSTDVYSFGLVLLEIASAGRKSREQVWELYKTNGAPMLMVENVADERLGGNFDREQMWRVLVVGLWRSEERRVGKECLL